MKSCGGGRRKCVPTQRAYNLTGPLGCGGPGGKGEAFQREEAAGGEGGMEGRRYGGREDSELEGEGGWGVVSAASFRALEVGREEKRKNKLLL